MQTRDLTGAVAQHSHHVEEVMCARSLEPLAHFRCYHIFFLLCGPMRIRNLRGNSLFEFICVPCDQDSGQSDPRLKRARLLNISADLNRTVQILTQNLS